MLAAPLMQVRFATHADIPDIQRIGIEADSRYLDTSHPECADGTTIPKGAAERAVESQRLVVACVGNAICGWALVGKLGDAFCLGQISVSTYHGKCGIGSQLLRRVFELARERGAASIVLNTQRDVAWCMPWYAKHGFVEVQPEELSAELLAVQREQTAAGLDWGTRVHMRLRLAQSA
jgi:predicted N-acetyltransferase YhbS